MSVVLFRKPAPLPAWHLADQNDMVAALTALKDDGWRGTVAYDDSTNGWRLELLTDHPTRQIIAAVGDWLVIDMGLRLLTAQDCADNYDGEAGS